MVSFRGYVALERLSCEPASRSPVRHTRGVIGAVLGKGDKAKKYVRVRVRFVFLLVATWYRLLCLSVYIARLTTRLSPSRTALPALGLLAPLLPSAITSSRLRRARLETLCGRAG